MLARILLLQRKVALQYDRMYSKYPIPTAASTMIMKASACDATAQKIENPCCRLDYPRMARFALFCACYVGAFQHILFNTVYTRLFPGDGFKVAVQKTLFDNFVHAPFIYLPTYYAYKNIFIGAGLYAAVDEYKDNSIHVLQNCWMLWVPAQFCTFYVIPPNFRILFNAAVGIVWEVIMSSMSPMRIGSTNSANSNSRSRNSNGYQ
mmetsp:Transcript_22378/g.37428  ORF Transcript_22378/g.37428 Transcript_22378/m.37428 type:complete len:206 (+) Transcript_22378:87-704(+)